MGCASSASSAHVAASPTLASQVVTSASPTLLGAQLRQGKKPSRVPEDLYDEHQKLLEQAGAKYHNWETSFTQKDALVVVDMQNDFTPDGGMLSVTEGADCAGVVVKLIEKAAKAGATIIVYDCHCSSLHKQGPYCAESGQDSSVSSSIARALEKARREENADIRVVCHGCPDRLVCHGSSLDAPVDAKAILMQKRITEHLRVLSAQRIYVVGLAMDVCVLDTAIKAASLKVAQDGVFLPVDASRAVHIPLVGAYGSGFVTDPQSIVSKAVVFGVKLCHAKCILGKYHNANN